MDGKGDAGIFEKTRSTSTPFYYHTSAHNRFYEGSLSSFDEKSKKAKRKQIPRYELLGANERVTVATRQQFCAC